MAVMIPASLDVVNHSTAGEKRLFRVMRDHLPDTFTVRYEMILGQRDFKPDFTIFEPARGLLIVEVKDWVPDNFKQISRDTFMIRGYGGSSIAKPIQNPSLKCEEYLLHARTQLRAMPELHSGITLNLETNYAVAFPNLSRADFTALGLENVMPLSNVLLSDDLGSDGKRFVSRLDALLPAVKNALTDAQSRAVIAALCPDLRVPISVGVEKAHTGIVVSDKKQMDWYTISVEQEQVAKSIGEGHRLLRGIAGTGKTLILLYRAKLLAVNDPGQRILVLCWNTSLANFMRQTFDALTIEGARSEQGEVQITHFAEFIKELMPRLGQQWENLDSPQFLQRLAGLAVPETEKYGAVFVDEAQDFRKEWIEFLYNQLIKGDVGKRSLIISADDAQRIYHQRDFQWAALDLPENVTARGRSQVLKTIYRNSARVWCFAAFLQPERAAYLQESDRKVGFSAKGGFDPQLVQCSSLYAQIEEAVKLVRRFHEAGFTYRNILILYRHKAVADTPIVDLLRKQLQANGIPFAWISQDAEAKRNFDWQDDSVKLSSVHSAKGMDAPVVIILGAETFDSTPEDEMDETKLMYVAMTRAREVLFVLYSGNMGLVPRIKECNQRYLEYRPAIVGFEQ